MCHTDGQEDCSKCYSNCCSFKQLCIAVKSSLANVLKSKANLKQNLNTVWVVNFEELKFWWISWLLTITKINHDIITAQAIEFSVDP